IVKDRLYNNKRGKNAKTSAQHTLSRALNAVLKMFAPIMPFITEEIYQNYFAGKEKCRSIHVSSWPEIEKISYDNEEKIGDYFVEVLGEVRKFKAGKNLSLKTPVKLTIPKEKEKVLKDVLNDLKAVCGASEINFGNRLEIRE
ncbi:MAG: class I tRNA ligase family protein, partial [Nanoarchaeota archaeon]